MKKPKWYWLKSTEKSKLGWHCLDILDFCITLLNAPGFSLLDAGDTSYVKNYDGAVRFSISSSDGRRLHISNTFNKMKEAKLQAMLWLLDRLDCNKKQLQEAK